MHHIFLLNPSSLISAVKSIPLFRPFSPFSRTPPSISSILSHHPPFLSYTPFCTRVLAPPLMAASGSLKPAPSGSSKLPLDELVGIARKCWIKFQRDITFALYSPFLLSLAAGDLKIQSFSDYIAQDVNFLKAFAQAYELAEECADDDDAKVGINELRKNVLEELKMHNSFVEEWGLDLTKETSVNPACGKYTNFLLATASGKLEGVKAPGKLATPFEKTKVAAYTLGAMIPCMRLYAYLGKELQALLYPSESNHPYKKWIEKYSSESFQESALQTEDLLDKLSVSLTGEELGTIEKLYHQAMKLEIDFFLAQPLVQQTVVPLLNGHNAAEDQLIIFSDFDLTCTVVDSSAILAEIAILTAPKSDQNQPEDQIARMSSTELRNSWSALSKQYTEEYEQCIESILSTDKAEKFNYEGLHKSLQQLSDFERRANIRVIESGVLKGLNLEDIKRAGERLILQDGCPSFFRSLMTNEKLNVNVNVLSYCWCDDLIRSSFSSGGIDSVAVHANEFIYQESFSTGEIVKKVESPIDKVQAFSNIVKNSSSESKNVALYIGDSVGDLLCLLEADVGIVVGSSSSLRKIGTHFGVSFIPLYSGLVEKQKKCSEASSPHWKGRSGILYTVSSWAEIHAFVLGQ